MRRLLFASLAIMVVAAAMLWLRPGYIVPDVPVQRHLGGGPFWHEVHRTELSYDDTAGVLYVHRQAGTAYPEPQGWHTVADVIAFFDERLGRQGWTEIVPIKIDDPAAPESRLLPKENTRQYYRKGDAHPAPYVIVAVSPIAGGAIEGFRVAMISANPSLLMKLQRGFD
jgi:hypothetical protein